MCCTVFWWNQVEAYSLEKEGCPLICRFATMGAVRSIRHSKIGKDSATDLQFHEIILRPVIAAFSFLPHIQETTLWPLRKRIAPPIWEPTPTGATRYTLTPAVSENLEKYSMGICSTLFVFVCVFMHFFFSLSAPGWGEGSRWGAFVRPPAGRGIHVGWSADGDHWDSHVREARCCGVLLGNRRPSGWLRDHSGPVHTEETEPAEPGNNPAANAAHLFMSLFKAETDYF